MMRFGSRCDRETKCESLQRKTLASRRQEKARLIKSKLKIILISYFNLKIIIKFAPPKQSQQSILFVNFVMYTAEHSSNETNSLTGQINYSPWKCLHAQPLRYRPFGQK
jgi:hypothetical protein